MYTLKNADSDFKKGLVKEPKKVRFSIYIQKPFVQSLEEIVENQDLDSRNQAIVEAIQQYLGSKGVSK